MEPISFLQIIKEVYLSNCYLGFILLKFEKIVQSEPFCFPFSKKIFLLNVIDTTEPC